MTAVGNGDHLAERRRRRRLDREAAAWLMLSRVMGALVILALLVATYFWFIPEVQEKERLGKVLQSKFAELERERLLGRQRERERQLLQNDPEYIETVARDRLDLMKDGETIFRMDLIEDETLESRGSGVAVDLGNEASSHPEERAEGLGVSSGISESGKESRSNSLKGR